MTAAPRITLIEMDLVLAAMALVLAAMPLLVRLRAAEPEVETTDAERVPQAASDDASSKLRVAMIAAMARARSQAALPPPPLREAGAPSSRWAHHQARQLYSLLRRRA